MRHPPTRAWLFASMACCVGVRAYSQTTDTEIHSDGVAGTHIGSWLLGTDGTIEAGAILGHPPFTDAGGGDLNFRGRGDWSLSLLKVPIKVMFDLGTDVAERGQRNRFSVQIDRQQLMQRANLDNTAALRKVNLQLDSLTDVRAARYRQWVAARETKASVPTITDSLPSIDSTSVDSSIPLDTGLTDSLSATLPGTAVNLSGASIGMDSLTAPDMPETSLPVEAARDSLDAVEAMIDELKQEQSKLKMIEEAGRKNKLLQRLSSGIRKFQIGSCTGAPSEFLINGLTHVGVSFELASTDLYVAFDHGRSYDDAWRNTNATSDRLQQLQRTVFFEDGEDLNPRRLTSAKVGFGLPEATHVHVGYLYGQREDAPLGVEGHSLSSITGINQVAEIDAGIEVAKGHALRIVFGRSVLNRSGGSDDVEPNGLFDPGEKNNQALLVTWRSRVERTRTEVECAYRSIDPLFHSMGMAFVRNGSRAVELNVAQRIGRRLRIRAGGKVEERTPLNSSARTDIKRGRVNVAYRPAEWCSFRGTYAPVVATTRFSDTVHVAQHSAAAQFGTELMRRFRHNRVLVNADASRYEWESSDTLGYAGEAWTLSAGCSFQVRDRLDIGASVTSFMDAVDTGNVSTTSLRIGWRGRKGAEAFGTCVFDGANGGPPTWNCSVKQPLGKGWHVRVEAAHLSNRLNFSSQSFAETDVDNYTCRVLLGFTW